jgi:hypothetical protein
MVFNEKIAVAGYMYWFDEHSLGLDYVGILFYTLKQLALK